MNSETKAVYKRSKPSGWNLVAYRPSSVVSKAGSYNLCLNASQAILAPPLLSSMCPLHTRSGKVLESVIPDLESTVGTTASSGGERKKG